MRLFCKRMAQRTPGAATDPPSCRGCRATRPAAYPVSVPYLAHPSARLAGWTLRAPTAAGLAAGRAAVGGQAAGRLRPRLYRRLGPHRPTPRPGRDWGRATRSRAGQEPTSLVWHRARAGHAVQERRVRGQPRSWAEAEARSTTAEGCGTAARHMNCSATGGSAQPSAADDHRQADGVGERQIAPTRRARHPARRWPGC
jgi:hypothetical protein